MACPLQERQWAVREAKAGWLILDSGKATTVTWRYRCVMCSGKMTALRPVVWPR